MIDGSPETPVDRKPRSGNGLAIGVAVGVALGVAMDQLAVGIALGIAIGVAINSVSRKRKYDS